MRIEGLLKHFGDVRRTADDQWQALCPAHDDHKPSLSIGVDGSRVLIDCKAGCSPEAVVRAAGLTMRDLFLDDCTNRTADHIEAVYDYADEQGALLFQVVRMKPKRFFQRRPDGKGSWINDRKGVRPVLYRLPELLEAHPDDVVYITEGEKDANRLAELGLMSTTNPGGAGKWRSEYNDFLKDRQVVVLPDNDPSGKEHAECIRSALTYVADRVTVLELPDLPQKGDVFDWLETHNIGELMQLAEEALTPSCASVWNARGVWTVAELLAFDDPMPTWVVPDLLPEGVTILAGKPKVGKSWLALGLAVQIAKDSCVGVLYLALEDNRRRMKQRLQILLDGANPPDSLLVATQWKRFPGGGLDALSEFISEHSDTRLIVVDTLARVKDTRPSRKSAYDLDYNDLAGLHTLTSKRAGLAIIVIHHLRKALADNPVDLVSGTAGLTACADAFAIMTKGRGHTRYDAKLFIVGRDIEEREIALRRNIDSPQWIVLGAAEEYEISEERHKICCFLQDLEEPAGPRAIADGTGIPYDSVKHLVRRMTLDGQLSQPSNGVYEVNTHMRSPFTMSPVTTSLRDQSRPVNGTQSDDITVQGESRTGEYGGSDVVTPSDKREQLEGIAESRTALHTTHASRRPLSADYDLVGVAGERAFAKTFDLPLDGQMRPSGDGGVDFMLPNGLTVDVKTFRRPLNLLREAGREEAEILVLAGYDDSTGNAELIGWEWDHELVTCPTRDFGHGILNHYKPAEELRPIGELHQLACTSREEASVVPS